VSPSGALQYPQSRPGEVPSQVKVQPASSPVLSDGESHPLWTTQGALGLLWASQLQLFFSSSCTCPPQLMLMSVLTCLFDSLSHVLR
jgi:hypothetical protein